MSLVLLCWLPSTLAQQEPPASTNIATAAGFDALFPCPETGDEFARRRCEESLGARRRALRDGVRDVFGVATVGEYDFRRHRFPVTIYAVGLVDQEGGEEHFLVVSRNNLRTIHTAASTDDWPVLARTYAEFDDDRQAEAWAQSLPGEGQRVGLVQLYFRVQRGITARLPENTLVRATRRHWNRQLRQAGIGRRVGAQRQEVRGALVRFTGWALLAPTPEPVSGTVGRAGPDTRAALAEFERFHRAHFHPMDEEAQRLAAIYNEFGEYGSLVGPGEDLRVTQEVASAAVRLTLNRLRPALGECGIPLDGVTITVAPTGTRSMLTPATVRDALGEPASAELQECLQQRIRMTRFPLFDEPVRVTERLEQTQPSFEPPREATAERLRSVARRGMPQLRSCTTEPVRFEVRFDVRRDGVVHDAVVDGSGITPSQRVCLEVQAASSWFPRLPRPRRFSLSVDLREEQ